ncbi:MAG TPA: SpoIID/LytB domain-containing protein [Bacteroidia bacterium]|jgi:stage II sporulation protein D|nr:SpoIID/LytB domain-containing protein [Bacteroidia bacterium]
MRKYHFLFLVLLFRVMSGTASPVDIGLYTDCKPQDLMISISAGKYLLKGDGKIISDTLSASILEFRKQGDSIWVKTLERSLGRYRNLSLTAIAPGSSFKLRMIAPAMPLRFFEDDLFLKSGTDQIRLINHLDIEKYVAGVVEAESGTIAEEEFYKVQSILCRTYALANLGKHAGEGFNLCDKVHCQVFRGKTRDPHVYFASRSTKDLVAVDNDLRLISTTFSSNCGGQTANAEDVWGKPAACLKSVPDSFCIHMPHAHWERRISIEDWKSYLELKHRYPVNDSIALSYALNVPKTGRSVYFTDRDQRIPLTTIRNDFQLKSTFFSVAQKNDSIIITGRGYGHGVGLCQEGAMQMAKRGYSYSYILNYYYHNINIIDIDKMEFFKEGDEAGN